MRGSYAYHITKKSLGWKKSKSWDVIFAGKFWNSPPFFKDFQGFSIGKKGDTLPSSTGGTASIQLHFMITFTDIDGIFAPTCTSPEFQLKVSFTIEKKTKMQKLFKFL